jgi:Lon protease-like protein
MENPMSKFQVPEWIPIFPLPNVVFFPKTYLPLHIFEPRYCQMIQEALTADRVVGMVLLKEGWEETYDQNPAIYEVGSVGKIVRSQRFDDGKYDIILYGLKRFTVRDEKFDKPYRQGKVDLLSEPPAQPLPLPLKQSLVKLLTEFYHQSNSGEEMQSILELGLEDDALIATLAAGLPFTVLEKQFLLEAETLYRQGRRLADLIQLRLHAIPGGNEADAES